jgi:hypothetical protein
MSRRILAGVLLATLTGATAHAQFAVIDPSNLAQAVVIAERTWNHWQELRRQFDTIRRMAQGLGAIESFRVPSLAAGIHDATRWPYGGSWLEGLNAGDPTGSRYDSVAVPLERPGVALAALSPAARAAFERQYATVEIADSVAILGGHQVATIRTYYDRLRRAIDALEGDVLNPQPRYHEMTALLDQIAAGELLGRRQDMATNQLISYALEQLVARSKRMRDTEASLINMQVTTWRDAHAASHAFVAGTGEALRTWRQP